MQNPTNSIQYGFYRHYKGGGLYEVICEAILESDRTTVMVVYKTPSGQLYTRTQADFFSTVNDNGKMVERFSKA